MAKKNGNLSASMRNALIRMYESGGGKMSRPDDSVVRELESRGFISSKRNLCWAWATYQLSPTGLETASRICGF